MIEQESTAELRVFNTDNDSIGGMSQSSARNNRRDYDRAPENAFITNAIINGGKWVFLSNQIVAYWPFAIQTSNDTHLKYLSFQFPTFGLFVTVLYLILNVSYLTHYFIVKLEDDAKDLHPFDLLCLMIWDSMIMVGTTACRLYGIWRLKKVHAFWNRVVSIVTQFTAISSEEETERKFQEINNWGLKWFAAFTAIGIINGSAVFYNDHFNHKETLDSVIIVEYIDTVICSHNSSAFLLIFFVKIMTHGFTTCRRKLEQLTTQNYDFVTQSYVGETTLSSVLKLIRDLQKCVASFNSTFIFTLFVEASFSFWQIMFALYFVIVVDPFSNVLAGINMMVPILSYSTCLVCLCMASSKLTVECHEMLEMFQELPISKLSVEDGHKVQLLMTRLTSEPPGVQVSQLFQIRESLLGSALNTFATYFIVLVQMRQLAHSKDPKVEEPIKTNLTEN